MCDAHTILHHGPVGMGVLLSRDFMGADQYCSRFSLPVESNAFSTERKVVDTGEGHLLKQFLEGPVHTSPDRLRPATRVLPKWIYQAVEQYIVQSGRSHLGYTFELIGFGHPSITWRLKRLVSRRAMRYNPVKRLGATGSSEQHKTAMDKLAHGKPLAFKSEFDKFIIDHWFRRIHFILKMTAFESRDDMDTWIDRHPKVHGYAAPIDRRGARRILSNPDATEKGRPWFKTVGCYALPHNLLMRMDPDAQSFAFSQLKGTRLARAYFSRGPDNPFLNLLNIPLEAASFHRQQCPPGSVLTAFDCDLRLEIYK